jgi:hypothetical protein
MKINVIRVSITDYRPQAPTFLLFGISGLHQVQTLLTQNQIMAEKLYRAAQAVELHFILIIRHKLDLKLQFPLSLSPETREPCHYIKNLESMITTQEQQIFICSPKGLSALGVPANFKNIKIMKVSESPDLIRDNSIIPIDYQQSRDSNHKSLGIPFQIDTKYPMPFLVPKI